MCRNRTHSRPRVGPGEAAEAILRRMNHVRDIGGDNDIVSYGKSSAAVVLLPPQFVSPQFGLFRNALNRFASCEGSGISAQYLRHRPRSLASCFVGENASIFSLICSVTVRCPGVRFYFVSIAHLDGRRFPEQGVSVHSAVVSTSGLSRIPGARFSLRPPRSSGCSIFVFRQTFLAPINATPCARLCHSV